MFRLKDRRLLELLYHFSRVCITDRHNYKEIGFLQYFAQISAFSETVNLQMQVLKQEPIKTNCLTTNNLRKHFFQSHVLFHGRKTFLICLSEKTFM